MNEAEYLIKNYGGGCYPPYEISIILQKTYDMKTAFNNCFIIHSK